MNSLKAKSLLLVILSVLIAAISPTPAFSATVSPGAACSAVGAKSTVNKVIFQCVKVGTKKAWKRIGVITPVVPSPTPSATPTASPISAIKDFQGNNNVSSGVVTLNWTKPEGLESFKYFELGVVWQLSATSNPDLKSSYSPVAFFRVTVSPSISLTYSEIRGFLADRMAPATGKTYLFTVRAVTETQVSAWSSFIGDKYDYIAQDPVAAPPPVAAAPPTSGSGGSGSVRTYAGSGSVSCPSGTSAVSGGLGTIPAANWNDLRGYANDYVTVSRATGSLSGNTYRATGSKTTYSLQSNGSYVAPNGAHYFVFASGSWTPPVWISCRG